VFHFEQATACLEAGVDVLVEKFSELRERLGINSFLVGGLDELGPVVERLAGT